MYGNRAITMYGRSHYHVWKEPLPCTGGAITVYGNRAIAIYGERAITLQAWNSGN